MTTARTNPPLTQQQINEFFLCSTLPSEVEKIIICHTLLEHVAYGRLNEAEAMIAYDPNLLLGQYASNVVTPSGLHIKNITPFECALSGGDVGMAKMMLPYFDTLKDGDVEQSAQYEKYRPHLESIMQQTPYDLKKLVAVLINSSDDDVQAELNRHKDERYKNYHSELREELEKFREAFTPGEMTSPQMQFNYMSLYHAYHIYDRELYTIGIDKCHLFCSQVIGFEQRSLSGRDRQIYAGSLYCYMNCEEKAPRTFELANDKGSSFPETVDSSSHEGLGFDFYIDLFAHENRGEPLSWLRWTGRGLCLQNLCQARAENLQNLCRYTQGNNPKA